MEQPASILATKLCLPPTRHLVQRPRLLGRINRLRSLTLIAAPAGFGKTTLAREWIAQLDLPVAWLSLDEDDNDPTRFLTYLIAALQTLTPDTGETVLPLLQASQPPPPKAILTTLIQDIHALPAPFVLVLDDYHLIETQPIHDALAFLADHHPPQMHLLIISRADPPLPLARWRVRDQLTELRADDLRFTSAETAEFLNRVMLLNLSMEDVAALEQRTEGWIAGLQLAALSIQGHHDASGFIAAFTGSNRYVVDYLVEEVLQRQPPHVQAFLLQTALLDRLTAPLCDAVIGSSESSLPPGTARTLLEYLDRANLFLIPLDDKRQWYRYHHLFAEVLRQRMQQAQPDRWLELHQRASEWHEQQRMIREAVAHALAAQDFKRAARLIAQSFYTLWVQGELATLLTWIKALPEDELRAHPQGNIGYAWALAFTGHTAAAEARLQLAEQALQTHAAAESSGLDDLWGQAIALHARLAAHRGDWQTAIDFAQTALRRLSPQSVIFRGGVYYSRALAYRLSGDLSEARRASAEASAFGWATGNYLLAVNSERNAALAQAAQGHLRAAAATYRQTLAKVQAHANRILPVAGIAHVGHAELCYQENDLDAAAQHVQTGLALGREGGLADILFYGGAILAQLNIAQGAGAAAIEALWEAEQVLAHIAVPHAVQHMKALEALIHLRLGRHEAVALWAQTYRDSSVDRTAYAHEFESLVLVRALIACGDIVEAAALLAQLLSAAEAATRTGSMIEILALQALAGRGDSAEAFPALARALTLAEPEGYVRAFVDEGAAMWEAIRDWRLHVTRGGSPEISSRLLAYADKLLAALSDQVLIPHCLSPIADLQTLPEVLSERELEVLRLVAAGLSDRAIAQKLTLAIGTVKKHLNNIYGKLGVHTRTQALARASERHML